MTSPKHDPRKLLDKLSKLEEEDLSDPNVPEEYLDQVIREGGGDPDAIGDRMVAFVEKLKKQFPDAPAAQIPERTRVARPAWQLEAEQRRQELQDKLAGFDDEAEDDLVDLDRDGLLAEIATLRRDRAFGYQMVAAFRKRKPETSSDEELRLMIRLARKLRAMAADGGDAGGEDA